MTGPTIATNLVIAYSAPDFQHANLQDFQISDGSQVWNRSIQCDGSLAQNIVAVHEPSDSVYVACGYYSVVSISAQTGSVKWKVSIRYTKRITSKEIIICI